MNAVSGFASPGGAQHATSLTEVAPRSLAAVRFRFAADGAVRGGFAIAGNTLLFGTEPGSFYAVDAGSGRLIWRRPGTSAVLSTPLAWGKRAFFTSWNNRLHAIDVRTGAELWTRDLGRSLGSTDYWEYYVSSPVRDRDRIIVGSGSGWLFAFAQNGKLLWSADAGARIRSTPAIANGTVFAGTNAGQVIAVSANTGARLWSFDTRGARQPFSFKDNDTRSVVTEPIVVGKIVIAGGRDGNIYGIDATSGKELWHETHDGGSWILGLAGDGDRFYSASGSAFIIQAASASTGHEIWRAKAHGALFGGLALADTTVVTNGSFGSISAFDTRSGTEEWRFILPDTPLSSPLVTRDTVYTGSDDGSVYALATVRTGGESLERFVYRFSNQPKAGFYFFKPEVIDAINGGLANSGYVPLGTHDLGDALRSGRSDRGRKVIVIADTRLPDEVSAGTLRHFLDDGGVIVLFGPNPATFQFDPDGSPANDDPDARSKAFGIRPWDKERDAGWNISTFTPDARSLGLTGQFPGTGVEWAVPQDVSIVLAKDRAGMVTAWIKRYANGGLLLELPLPRNRVRELAPYIDAIDLAVRRSSAERPQGGGATRLAAPNQGPHHDHLRECPLGQAHHHE